ncbi:hypothetical_protein [Candidozyma auris]|uniref:hypothetical_protein n=1 Tax=Candidozyma auris TaxID=498019 RepID=UPI000D2769BE|nr:hypothetical_protein [[Candida] auris]QEO20465.1 hypothetical_protein [[Candida] auris]GBL49561.1 hypothetical protein CAJCM15448_18350 [[Candida] auris]
MARTNKSKTFTGCFTCRSRKIRCDLRRPTCNNCKKAHLTCSGYDIKLRWSLPVEFTPKGRNPIQHPVKFPDNEADNSESGFFQRRHVGFVTWDAAKNCKPYETYEEMDTHLADLQSLKRPAQTVLRGPFGVFSSKRAKKIAELKRQSNSKQQPVPSVSEDDALLGHDQLWLSNELKDHALLTAAALNGDTQFLDLVDSLPNFSPSSSAFPGNAESNDFLNLVFHRHNNATNTNSPQGQATPSSMSSLLNPDENMKFPANQLYSNYNNFFYNNPYQLNKTLEIQLHASAHPSKHDDATVMVDGDNSSATHMPEDIMAIVERPLQPKLGFDISLPKNGVMLPTTALQVQPLTRYLLNYYVTQVADLMTVIPLTENPWKTIYFPRALMAIGELSALGKTSTAKNALLNALLAVAAFNLQSKFPKNSEPMKFYLNLGIRLRNQASVFVKTLLGSKSGSQSNIERCVANEKYKDVLCAVMSMISVDLVWGTMQDTNFYIKWCEKVIYTKMRNKKKLSPKARIMHRIFSSLKLIQDSTCLDYANIKEDYELSARFGYDVKLSFEKGTFSDSPKGRIDFIVDDRPVSSPMFVNKKLINTNKNDENFATDALYGLPNSLIVLFSETVSLLREKIYDTERKKLADDFAERVAKHKKNLQSWKLDWKLFDKDASGKHNYFTSMHEVTYHHIMSFYHALSIYFERLIEETPPEKLQDKVAQTLEHLNSIQGLIAKDEAHIIPLFWQGFIAGCEAVTSDLQMEFKKWGADIAQYLGSYWGARQIMLEVWRRKKLQEPRADWVNVIQDWEMNLMLN